MDKTRLISVFFMAMLALELPAEEVWKVTSLDWQPYSGETLANQGRSVEKLKQILQQAGITLVVEFYPWNRSKMLVKTNHEYIGIFPVWPEDTFEAALLSSPVDWSEIAVLKRAGIEVNFNSIDELFKKYSVGVVSTYIYPKKIMDAMAKHPQHTDGASNEVTLLKKLATGRNQVAITDPKVMLFLAKRYGIDNIEYVKKITDKELVLAFRDDEQNRKRLRVLNRLLQQQEK
ncbi:hypothetical protein SG34_014320 [Thalassomonas viridans]|uniref:Solute-binding protein family 3/N-terminal domain-containing protein n=1 Tax=Thalassomonas viridans TaxID=137584 RepID=A0AAE9Z8D6_9GAMM|nr:transporter substrate-binding domain-containing protein [Thalassomonas viridans]WDE07955.1 hypothetical protein SG34_014320 [Thalassomonas viridans]